MGEVTKGFINQKSPILVSLAYFLIQCGQPPCFYFIYIYCADILKHKCGFTPNQVINHNFWVSIVDLLGVITLVYLSYKIHPLKILKGKLFLFYICIISFPLVLTYTESPIYIFMFSVLSSFMCI